MAIRVGILTSGGDCPGLNATLRGVAKALYHRMGDKVEIVGIMNGYDGLINGNYREMSPDEFSGILTVGGTILGTKRTPFKKMRVVEDDKVDKVAAMKKNYRAAKLDCLLCLGGNLVHLVIAHNAHHLERGALGAKNRAAYRQNAGKLIRCHDAVVAVDQAVITVQNANDLHLVAHALIQRFGHAADGCVQAGAVTAGCQNTNTHLHRNLPVRPVPLAARVPRCCTMPGNVHTICIFYLLQYATQAVLSMRCGGSRGKIFVTIPKPGREDADAGFFTCLTKKSQR